MRSITSALFALAVSTVSAQNLLTGPNSLTFNATTGGSAPPSQAISLRHTGDTPRNFTLNLSTLSGGNWLSVSAVNGTTPARITVSANPTGIPAGAYTGTILISATGALTARVDVTLNVVASAQLSTSPTTLSFARQNGVTVAPNADEQLVLVNSSGSPVNYTVTPTTNDNGGWLLATASQSTPGFVTVRVNSAGLANGTYNGSLAIAAAGLTTVNVPVTLTVGANPIVSVSPTPVALAASRTGTAVTQSVTIATSSGTVPFTATASTATGGNWLIATPLIGSAPGSIDISANPAGLANGTYTGTVAITAAAAANPSVTIPVTFTVTDAPILSSITKNLTATVSADSQTGLVQDLPVVNITATGSSVPITTTVTTVNGGAWLVAAPDSGNAPGSIVSKVDATGLPSGTYRGQIAVNGPGNQVLISVVLTVTSGNAQVTIDPGTITFNLQKGQTPPSNQVVNILSSGAAYAYQSSITSITPANANWLFGAVSAGTTPASLTLGVNSAAAATLPNGQYTATITFAPQTGFSPAPTTSPTLNVVLNVSDTPLFNVTPSTMDFAVAFNGNPPPARTISVTATDNSSRAFTAGVTTSSGGNWLLVGPTTGNTPTNLSVQVLPFGLAVGTYEGTIAITVPTISTTPQNVRVRLIVQPAATIAATPTTLEFAQASGGAAPASKTIQVTSTAAANFLVTTSTVGGGNWLTVSPSGGTTPGTLTVNANGAGLTPGIYTGSIGISSSGVNNSPVVIPVTLTVAAPALSLTPTTVSLTTTPGSTAPVTQTIALTAGTATYTATASTVTGGNWLSVSPATGNAPATLTVTANPSGLAAGLYSGSIVVTAPGISGSPQTIPVTFTVVAVAPPGLQVLSQIADGAGWKTTITIVNLDVDPAPFTLRFYDGNGAALRLGFEGQVGRLEVLEGIIPVGGMRTIVTAGTDTLLSQGWAELNSTKLVSGLGVFRQRVTGRPDQEAGVSAIAPTSRFVLPYDNTQGFISSLALANTNSTSARGVTVSPRNEDGSLLIGDSINLPARGQNAFSMPERFPSIVNRRGSADFTSTGPDFAALGLRFNNDGSFTSLPSLTVPATAPTADVTQVISQVADGSGWKTTITLVNLDTVPAPYTLRFWRADGTALAMPLTSGSPSEVVEGTIPVGGTRVIETLGGTSALVQGWAQLTSSRNIGGLGVFRQRVAGRSDQEAAVQLTTTGTKFVLPFDNTTDFVTSMALVNSSATLGSTIIAVIRDENGTQIATDAITLPGRGYSAFALTERFASTRLRRGTVEFTATSQITGLGLRFNSGGAFTSFPVLPKR